MTQALFPREEIIRILSERDGYFCFLCKQEFQPGEEITLDHWIPRSKGGTWDVENLRLASKRCNALKSDRMPNPDGTLPVLKRELNAAERRTLHKDQRATVCEKCQSGRLLDYGDTCDSCGSLPQPLQYPRWAKMKPSECSHEYPFWCWMEALEPGLRKPAIADVLDGDGSLD